MVEKLWFKVSLSLVSVLIVVLLFGVVQAIITYEKPLLSSDITFCPSNYLDLAHDCDLSLCRVEFENYDSVLVFLDADSDGDFCRLRLSSIPTIDDFFYITDGFLPYFLDWFNINMEAINHHGDIFEIDDEEWFDLFLQSELGLIRVFDDDTDETLFLYDIDTLSDDFESLNLLNDSFSFELVYNYKDFIDRVGGDIFSLKYYDEHNYIEDFGYTTSYQNFRNQYGYYDSISNIQDFAQSSDTGYQTLFFVLSSYNNLCGLDSSYTIEFNVNPRTNNILDIISPLETEFLLMSNMNFEITEPEYILSNIDYLLENDDFAHLDSFDHIDFDYILETHDFHYISDVLGGLDEDLYSLCHFALKTKKYELECDSFNHYEKAIFLQKLIDYYYSGERSLYLFTKSANTFLKEIAVMFPEFCTLSEI